MPASTEPGAVDSSTRPPRPGRIASLDVARGLVLIINTWITSLFVLPRPDVAKHAFWDEGITGADWIFPMFVTLSGCGLAFAFARGVNWRVMIRRSVVLFACSLVYNTILQYYRGVDISLTNLKLSGPLTLYAVLCLAIGLIHLRFRTWQPWLVLSIVLSVGYTALLWGFAQTCDGGVLTRDCNPSGWLDPRAFGETHMYRLGVAGHDPEGLFGMLGAFISTTIGATMGHLMLAARRRPRGYLLSRLALCIGLWVVVLQGSQQFVPAFKRLWTPGFALQVGWVVALALAVGFLLLDRRTASRARERVTYPVIAMGRNPLLLFFGTHLAMAFLGGTTLGGDASLLERIGEAIAIGGHVQATWSVLMVVGCICFSMLLHHRRIYIRA